MKWFFFFCFAPILPLVYFFTRNEAKPKNNLILSTTLPKEAWEDEKVLAVLRSFRLSLNVTCILLALLLLPAFFISYVSVLTAYYLLWTIALVIVPNIPYCIHVNKMRALKKQYWYHPEAAKMQVVDTKTSEQSWKALPSFTFLLPFLLSLVPMLYPLMVPSENSYLSLYIICVTNSACIVLFYLCYRFLIRKKSDRINADMTLTMTLTRIRVYHWGRFWLICAWLTACYNFAALFLDKPLPLFFTATLIFMFLTLGVSIKAEFAVRRAQQHYNETEKSIILVDEDDFWWNGILYYNKNDSSTIVNARIGFGSTINLARPAGQIIMGLTVFLLLSMVPFCAWLIKEEFTDVRVEMTEDSIQAYHLSLEYEVPLEEITGCTLLSELPSTSKNVGTNFDRVYKGSFFVKGIDKNARVCLNPESELFLVLSTTDKTYIFSMGDESEEASKQLQEIYLAIKDYLSTKASETHP